MTSSLQRRLIITALFSGIAAVLSGVVIASGGGHLACRAWPLCLNEMSWDAGAAVWIPLAHRFAVLLCGLSTLAALGTVWARPADRLVRTSLTVAAIVTAAQSLFGAWLSTGSGRSIADLTHLSGALLSVGALAVAATAAWLPSTRQRLPERRRRLADLAWWNAAAGAVMVLVVSAGGVAELDARVQAFLPANALGATVFSGVLAGMVVWRVRTTPGISRGTVLLALTALTGTALVLATLILFNGSRIPAVFGATAAWLAALSVGVMVHRAPLQANGLMPQAVGVRRQQLRQIIDDYISLTKPKVILLLLATTLAAMFLTEAGLPSLWLVFWTMVGGYLAAGGAGAINCAFDSDIDVNMGRTSRRPVPSGRISARAALIFGLVLSALSLVVLAVFTTPAAALAALAGIIYYAYFYTTLLKRSTWQNIIIGGGAGAIPPLVGWTAMTGTVSIAAVILFAIIFYWTPPHFWALALVKRQDYARAGVPMLPVVAGDEETRRQIFIYSVLMLAVTLLPTAVGSLGWIYLAGALLLGGKFLLDAWAVRQVGDQAAIWGLYKYSLLYLFLLFAVMVVDRLVLG